MKIAVLSGKGGTGKTFVSVNIAACASAAMYLDCDVEEPNGRLFFKPKQVHNESVTTLLPIIDGNKCTACRTCVEFCRFNALAFLAEKPKVFVDVCHSCGGCKLVCPTGAIKEADREIGQLECGIHKNVEVVTGILNIGEASGVQVIKAVLRKSLNHEEKPIIIDCPPGSACTVMESVDYADYCILVAEPTVFGLHNFEMVYELVKLLEKPCGVVINKASNEETVLDVFCKEKNINVLSKISYSKKIALMNARAEIASENDEDLHNIFTDLLKKIVDEVAK